jgi:NAD(P)-dependent dehydrogenase (short-subunit alcohol dehydrogenase family)
MDLGLKGRVAIVTGSARGIGKAIAKVLLQEGCSVVICDIDKEELAKTESELRNYGNVLAVPTDVTDMDDVKRLVNTAVEKFGTIHILINNIGILGGEIPFHELSIEDWEAVYNVNIKGTVRVTKEVLPYMRKQKWGRIINIASEAASQPDDFKPHYDSSKAAIINLTKNLSKTYGKDGILVNAVSPATTWTPLVEEIFKKRAEKEGRSVEEIRDEFVRKERPNVVLRRLAEPEEIANVVVFLASEKASYVTGANYRVDGGSISTINV